MQVFLFHLICWRWDLWTPLHTAAADMGCRHRVALKGCARVHRETWEEIEKARSWRWLVKLADNCHSGGKCRICIYSSREKQESNVVMTNTFSCCLLTSLLNVRSVTVRPYSDISRECKKPFCCNWGNIWLGDLWSFRASSCWEQWNSPFTYLSTVRIAARLLMRGGLCRWEVCCENLLEASSPNEL